MKALKIMRKLFAGLFMSTLSSTALAADWYLDNAQSSLSFLTIKNDAVAEVQHFNTLDARVRGNALELVIDSESLETHIDIRNKRIEELVLKTDWLPDVYLSATLPNDLLQELEAGEFIHKDIALQLEMGGAVQSLVASVAVAKTAQNEVYVRSLKPVMFQLGDFNLESGVELLRGLAGLDVITKTIPTFFKLKFVSADQVASGEEQLAGQKPEAASAPSVSVNNKLLSLKWSDGTDSAEQYLVYQRYQDGEWEVVAKLEKGATFTHLSPEKDGRYAFAIQSVANGRVSDFSAITEVQVGGEALAPEQRFTASADVHSHKKTASENFANAQVFVTKRVNADDDYSRRAFVQFDLNAFKQGRVDAAELHLHAALGGGSGLKANVSVHEVSSRINEQTLTWDSQPAAGNLTAYFQVSVSAQENYQWYAINVRDALRNALAAGQDTLTLSLSTNDNLMLMTHSKEYESGNFAPYLVVNQAGSLPSSGDNADQTPGNGSGNGAGTEGNDSNGQDGNNGNNQNGNGDDADLLASGQGYWQQNGCAGCHGNKGDGQPNGSSIISGLYSSAIESIITTTMPYGSPGSCDSDCSRAIVAWLRSEFPQQGGSGNDEGQNSDDDNDSLERPDLEPLNEAQWLKYLHKASMNLVNRLPKNSEMSEVKNRGAQGFESTISNMVNEAAFRERVAGIYEDLLVDKANSPNNAYFKVFGGKWDYANDLGYDNKKRNYVRNLTRDSLRAEPLELIKYILKKDLPFTELLTADYVMMNYYSARAYNKHESLSFSTVAEPEYADYPYDPAQFKKVRVTDIPMAGVLSQHQFLQKYPTTASNVNRHRAYTVFNLFLDTDILEISGSRVLPDDIAVDNPTLTNPVCTACHNVMDPVSSAFRHWQRGSERHQSLNSARWEQDGILEPGFNGAEMPLGTLSPLQWLSERVAQDRRFAVSTTKTLFTELTGHPLLMRPEDGADELARLSYDYQQMLIGELADAFVASQYDLKSLAKALVISEYFRDEAFHGGTAQLLDLKRYKQKLLVTTGVNSYRDSNKFLLSSIYQGNQPNGIMAAIHRITGASVACEAVPRDISKSKGQRLLLPYFEMDALPVDDDGQAIASVQTAVRKNIQNLMWVLWGESVALEDEQIDSYLARYLDLQEVGKATRSSRNLSGDCQYKPEEGTQVVNDENYLIRAWFGIVNAMLDDYRYLYE